MAFLTAQGYGTGTCTLIKESSLGDRVLDDIQKWPEPCVPMALYQVNSWRAASWWVTCDLGTYAV